MKTRLLRQGPLVLLILILIPLMAADPPRPLSVMALMRRQYNVSRAPFKILKAEMEAESPNWTKAAEAASKFEALATTLAERTPRQGTVESWRKFLDQHQSDARALTAATRAQDQPSLRAAHARIASSCQACHKAHRKRRGD